MFYNQKLIFMDAIKNVKKLLPALVLSAVFVMGLGISDQAHAQDGAEAESPITIVEYSDYQCPACGYYHPIVEKLKEKYGDRIQIELKYFPLNSHQYAALAARAAEAAKNQGKFKEMHNLLFENQKRWSNTGSPTSNFVNFAREIGLDIDEFKNDLNASETQKVVMEQREEGRSAGVNATPTFFIEGEKVDPLPRNFQEFDQLLKQYVNQEE